MNEDIQIYGAFAQVYLKYNGEIADLAEILSKDFVLREIDIDTDEDPPHEFRGMSEALGFGVWLNKSNRFDGYSFEFRMETSHCIQESFNGFMHDLSPWLARYIADICKIDSYIYSDKESKGALFKAKEV